jgi:electron transfer flavoprotein alpha/beta subunit
MTDLDARLLAAHAAGDRAGLIALYEEAARGANTDTARSFYLTHAYVFALEAGDPHAEDLRRDLVAMGREPAA